MEIKIHTCLLQILCFCGWTQPFNFILGSCCSFPSTAHSTATFCPTNNLMHSLLTTTSSHDVSHKLLSHCTNTVLSLFTSHTSILPTVKECSQILSYLCVSTSHVALWANGYFYWYSYCCHWYYVYKMCSAHTHIANH